MLIFTSALGLAATLAVGPTETYTTIQDALDAASAGDTIDVAAGTYIEDLTASVEVTIVGAGVGLTVLHPLSSTTLLDALDDVWVGDLTLDGLGTTNYLIDGLGDVGLLRAELLDSPTYGVVADRDLIVRDSHFEGIELGAVYTSYDLLDVRNSSFVGNGGKGYSGPAINGLFVRNPIIEGCWFEGNDGDLGGAVDLEASGFMGRVRDNTFVANAASADGGALRVLADLGDRVRIQGNLFQQNNARTGGGLYVGSACEYGSCVGPTMVVTNNTFVGNDASSNGAHVAANQTDLQLHQNIFTDGIDRSSVWIWFGTSTSDSYNLFWNNDSNPSGLGSYPGPTDIEDDPLFVNLTLDADPLDDDLSLQAGSPAIDAGNPSFMELDGTVPDLGWTGGR